MSKSIHARRIVALGGTLLLVIAASLAASAAAATFRILTPVRSDVLTYSDANITISFTMRLGSYGIGYSGISFTITNKSAKAIELDWDRSSVTLPDGQTSNVMHEGTLFIQRGTSTPPTTIPPGGKLSDSMIPSRNVYYSDGWNIQSMGIKAGSQFGLYLALNGIGTSNSYNFTFEAVQVPSEVGQVGNLLLISLVLLAVLGLISLALDL